MDVEQYYLDLKTQEPINYDGLIIYQPSFSEIKKYGIDKYNQIMLIYSLTIDCFDKLPDKENINLFDDLILNDDYLLTCLCESLYKLTKADEIILYKKSKCIQLKFIEIKKETITKKVEKPITTVINERRYYSLFDWLHSIVSRQFNKKSKIETNIEYEDITEELETKTERFFIINSSNFDDISNIILKINANKKVEVEKPPANMTDRQKDIWYKLQEGRKEDLKKNEVHIYDILNICEFGGDYHIPIETICSWSLWRIMNCYKARIGWKSYDDNLQIALISGDGKNISGENHWHQQLMIRE
jgi:hypothetical protein